MMRLLCGYVLRFCRYIGLSCGYIGLFIGYVGLFCRNSSDLNDEALVWICRATLQIHQALVWMYTAFFRVWGRFG